MSNQLIRKSHRKVVLNIGYGGVCHACNSPVAYDDEMLLVEVIKTDVYWIGVPVDIYECPHCNTHVETIRIYKSLEVSKELSKV